jgi:hypothetical protein
MTVVESRDLLRMRNENPLIVEYRAAMFIITAAAHSSLCEVENGNLIV